VIGQFSRDGISWETTVNSVNIQVDSVEFRSVYC